MISDDGVSGSTDFALSAVVTVNPRPLAEERASETGNTKPRRRLFLKSSPPSGVICSRRHIIRRSIDMRASALVLLPRSFHLGLFWISDCLRPPRMTFRSRSFFGHWVVHLAVPTISAHWSGCPRKGLDRRAIKMDAEIGSNSKTVTISVQAPSNHGFLETNSTQPSEPRSSGISDERGRRICAGRPLGSW